MSTHDSTVAHQLVAWDRMPVDHPAQGIERRMIWGDLLMICRLRFDPHVVTAVHTHPHEHAAMLEEVYLYIDMPAPAFGVQYVYTDRESPEIATFVREGDCVIIPQGYHPNVAAPGARIGFLWFMAAHREGLDRQFGVVNVQPEFAQQGSGLDQARERK